MQQLLAIAGGGALGAVLRFGMSNSIDRLLGRDFPYGTLAVNILGSLLVETCEWRGAIVCVAVVLERMIVVQTGRLGPQGGDPR